MQHNPNPQKPRNYSPMTQELVFRIADMGASMAAKASLEGKLTPVLMIDGPAGTGKSTFAHDLTYRLKELKLNVCLFEQDRFGVFRDIRSQHRINPCSDLARDPQTVDKLKEVMERKTAKVPDYNTKTGVRIKDAIPLPPGDIIVYEGVSSLSAVIYENSKFGRAFQEAVAIKVFFRSDTEETLYQSRLKRDMEERNADPLNFSDNWDDNRRNNWIYSMRGIFNANFVITRKAGNEFHVDYSLPLKIPCSYQLENRVRYQSTLSKERQLVFSQNLDRWFTDYHTAISCGFILQKQLTDLKMSLADAIKNRDQVVARLLVETKQNSKPKAMSIADDHLVVPKQMLNLAYRAATIFCIDEKTPKKSPRARDDMAVLEHRRYGTLFQRTLLHDAKFNNKNRIGVENALAAITLDNVQYFMPSIKKITDKILKDFFPLANKFINNEASQEEINAMHFLLSPFMPNSPDAELSRMPSDLKSEPSEIEVAKWLLNKLVQDNDAFALFLSIRFHIRFMHFIAEQGDARSRDMPPAVPPGMFTPKLIERIQKLNKELRIDAIFDRKQNRGRITLDTNKRAKLTTSFGTYVDIHDVPLPFRKLIGQRSLTLHSAGKQYLIPVPTTLHNNTAMMRDIPLISSGSGAMPFLLCAALYAELSSDDLKMYHLACITNMIAGGHHSLAECLAVSQACIPFQDRSVASIIPESLKQVPIFADFIKLTNRREFQQLWVDEVEQNQAGTVVITSLYQQGLRFSAFIGLQRPLEFAPVLPIEQELVKPSVS